MPGKVVSRMILGARRETKITKSHAFKFVFKFSIDIYNYRVYKGFNILASIVKPFKTMHLVRVPAASHAFRGLPQTKTKQTKQQIII